MRRPFTRHRTESPAPVPAVRHSLEEALGPVARPDPETCPGCGYAVEEHLLGCQWFPGEGAPRPIRDADLGPRRRLQLSQ